MGLIFTVRRSSTKAMKIRPLNSFMLYSINFRVYQDVDIQFKGRKKQGQVRVTQLNFCVHIDYVHCILGRFSPNEREISLIINKST